MIVKRVRKRVLCAALGGLGLLAQSDPSDAVMEKMYAKLASSFSATQALGQGGAFLLLTRPGLPITPEQTKDPYEIARILDRIPLTSRQYTATSDTYSSVYGSILRLSQVTRYQNQADLNKIHDTKRLLYDRTRPGQPTVAYAAYLKYRAAHAQALDAQTLAKTEQQASGKPILPGLDTAVNQALRQWEQAGYKALIDTALAYQRQAYNSNVRSLFFDLNRDLRTMVRQDGHPTPWYPVLAEPPIKDWLSQNGWQTWSFQKNEHSDPAAKAPAAAIKSAPGAAPSTQAEVNWMQSLTMSAQVKRVSITRPWMDPGIFHSQAWKLPASGGFTTVSTGNPADQAPGMMPLLVTGLLLAKDLIMSGTWDSVSGQPAPQALGPFALSAPGTSGPLPLRPYVSKDGGQLAIRVEGTQIIGFFCELVPKSPSPDPKFFR